MRQRLFEINEQDAFEEAKQRFIKTCGFDLQKNKHQKMMEMGEKVREDGIDGIEIRAMLSFCDKSILTDEGLKVAGETLAFSVFGKNSQRCGMRGVFLWIDRGGMLLLK